MRSSDAIPLMLITAILCATASGSVAQSMSGQCFICDDVVVLDETAAECFRRDVATALAEAKIDGYAKIDLTTCTGADGTETRGALEQSFESPASRVAVPKVRSSFVLDAAAIICLDDLLAGAERPITPARRYDLTRQCQKR